MITLDWWQLVAAVVVGIVTVNLVRWVLSSGRQTEVQVEIFRCPVEPACEDQLCRKYGCPHHPGWTGNRR